eukprot:symbB.v1.2.023813.t1/scaffold2161.1/size87477/11
MINCPGGPSNRSRSSAELATTLSEDLQSSGDAAAGPKASKHTAEPMVPKLAIFDRKARLQAQLSRPSSSLQPQRPAADYVRCLISWQSLCMTHEARNCPYKGTKCRIQSSCARKDWHAL